MRIALFPSAFHPHVGGVEELVRQLAIEYRDRGHDVIVVTNRWPPELAEHEEVGGTDVYRFPLRLNDGPLRARLRYAMRQREVTQQIVTLMHRHRIEVVHVQCVSVNGHYAHRAADALGLPLVVTAQGERTMDATWVYERSSKLNRVLRDLLDRADRLTACSQATLDDLLEYRGSAFAQPASVIYNGISLEELDDPTIMPFALGTPYVLGIGRWVPQKGFDVLIDAFADAAAYPGFDHHLVLAGAGDEGPNLERLIAEHGLEERVHLLGLADRRMVVALFKGCSIFVLPSRQEPLGIVNLEAMGANRPVIASRVGGVPEIVCDSETGMLVPPGDAAVLAEALLALAADPDRRHQLGAAGRRRAEAFGWTAIASQYLDLYRELV